MTPLYGLILAGGRSERMGKDKAALQFHGIMQTHHLARLLAPFVQKVLISVRAEQADAAFLQGLTPVFDQYPSPTPLNGIASAMREYPGISMLVVAVDMPFIDAVAIETLIHNRNSEAVATCFASPVKGGPDPLLAIWEAHAFARIEAAIAKETQHVCPRNLLKSLPAHILAGKIAHRVLDNINTPQEWAAMQKVS